MHALQPAGPRHVSSLHVSTLKQPDYGATACLPCNDGAFCVEGASVVQLCPAGTLGEASGMTSEDDCSTCDAGTFCPVGASSATPCSAGTFSASDGQGVCARCAEGTYIGSEGATACLPCEQGHYCAEGASVALPCDAGSWSASTDLASQAGCSNCPAGSACPTGAAAPTQCLAGEYAAAGSGGQVWSRGRRVRVCDVSPGQRVPNRLDQRDALQPRLVCRKRRERGVRAVPLWHLPARL